MIDSEMPNEEREAEDRRFRLINMLREKGFENHEARDLVVEWRKKEEEKVDKLEGQERKDEQIQLFIRQAKLCAEAGEAADEEVRIQLVEQAIEQLESAFEYAFQEHNDTLCGEIEEMIVALEEKIKDKL